MKRKRLLRALPVFFGAALLTVILLFAGCKGGIGTMVVGKKIAEKDVTEFYYTYENINFNAEYLRYRFYTEDGKYWFFRDRRERRNEYGPATEADRVDWGTVELTAEQWSAFFALLQGGTVKKRTVGDESGDAGPWTFLYWTKDRGTWQDYSFPSLQARDAFESFCASLAEENRQ